MVTLPRSLGSLSFGNTSPTCLEFENSYRSDPEGELHFAGATPTKFQIIIKLKSVKAQYYRSFLLEVECR